MVREGFLEEGDLKGESEFLEAEGRKGRKSDSGTFRATSGLMGRIVSTSEDPGLCPGNSGVAWRVLCFNVVDLV